MSALSGWYYDLFQDPGEEPDKFNINSLKPKNELKYQNNLLRNKIINYYDYTQIYFNKQFDNYINEI